MSELDNLNHLRGWIGRTKVVVDKLAPENLKRFNVTVNDQTEVNEKTLLGIHYCLGNEALPRDQLGVDSHPSKGDFLPPVSLPRRMWASSKIIFKKPIPIDLEIEKTSTVSDVVEKRGNTGHLVFVTVDHEYRCGDNLLLREAQTIVYREAQPYKKAQPAARVVASHRTTVNPDATQLFRYSALTFNGHRIHYDQDYVTSVERYPGLVVHGPLTATLLMNMAQKLRLESQMVEFEFRGMAPAFVNEPLDLLAMNKDCTALEARNADSAIIMKANAKFGEDYYD